MYISYNTYYESVIMFIKILNNRGIPQGDVLSPFIFFTYVNDNLKYEVSALRRLFAEKTPFKLNCFYKTPILYFL